MRDRVRSARRGTARVGALIPALCLCLVVLLVSGVAQAAPAVRTFADDPLGVKEIVLDNGLTVLLSENHERAEVFGAVVVRAGGRDDPPEHTGIAHYLEHMLFKGTQELGTSDWEAERPLIEQIEALYEELGSASDDAARQSIWQKIEAASKAAARHAIPGELDNMLAELGSRDVNAFTSPDMTVYHDRFPASQIDAWLELYAHRFERPVFRLFASELETVYEEKNSSMDGYDAAYEAFMAAFFPEHPYGTQTILGSVEHLKRPSLTAMRRFYETHYVAGNMALVLSGAFDTEAVLPVIERTFGRWPAKPAPQRRKEQVDGFVGKVTKTVRLTPLRAGALGFRMPTREHPDGPAVAVLSQLLSNEQGSGLLDRLADDNGVLFAQAVHMDLHEHDGLVIVHVPRVVTQTFVGAERTIRKVLERIARGEIDAAAVRALRENLLRETKLSWESNEERALAMVDAYARFGGWQPHLDWLAGLRRVEAEDIARVAKRHLGADQLVVRSRMGKPDKQRLDKPGFEAVEPDAGARSAYHQRTRPIPPANAAPRWVDFDEDVTRVELAHGVSLAANDNPFNDIYRLEIRFGVGREHMPELAVATKYLESAGSTEHPAAKMKAALFDLATTLDIYATDEATVLRLQGPEAHLDEALMLVAQIMQSPATDRRRRRRIRRETWAEERIERGEPRSVARALFDTALHGDQARQRKHGRRAQRGYDVRSLLAAWKQAQRHAVELRYVGRQPIGEVARGISARLALAPDRPAVGKVIRPRDRFERDTVFFVKRRDAVQTQMYVFIEGDPVPPSEVPKLQAFDGYLGGDMGGIIFQEVREYRALAYSAMGGHAEPSVAGQPAYTWAHAACQADKTEETLAVLGGLLGDLPARPQRVDSVRSALVHGLESADPSFRELQAQIEAWRWQGWQADPRAAWLPAYRDLAFEDIEAFWRAHVAGRPRVLVVVGDPRRVDRSMLERFGRVEVLPERRLYAPPRGR